ncbi:hypothetical protein HDU97_002100 [Phlyctochytrium planicorne]|nr:hypothetical protein HDU97_002100 [Phlyctochytrium planicorne]
METSEPQVTVDVESSEPQVTVDVETTEAKENRTPEKKLTLPPYFAWIDYDTASIRVLEASMDDFDDRFEVMNQDVELLTMMTLPQLHGKVIPDIFKRRTRKEDLDGENKKRQQKSPNGPQEGLENYLKAMHSRHQRRPLDTDEFYEQGFELLPEETQRTMLTYLEQRTASASYALDAALYNQEREKEQESPPKHQGIPLTSLFPYNNYGEYEKKKDEKAAEFDPTILKFMHSTCPSLDGDNIERLLEADF